MSQPKKKGRRRPNARAMRVAIEREVRIACRASLYEELGLPVPQPARAELARRRLQDWGDDAHE